MSAMRGISGATRLAAVIGDPVRHSRSPELHNAAYAATGLDWVYVALPVPAGHGADAVRAMPVLGIRGLNVTMPHKATAAGACDELSPAAAALGAVNTVVLGERNTLRGDSTDGEGFLRSLADAGVDPAGATVLVLGAGGAARAVVLALGGVGASVTVVARRPEAGSAAALLAPGATSAPWAEAARLGTEAEILVNATPVGMADAADPTPAGLPVPGAGQWAVDLVYHPARTGFIAAAEAAGARVIGGLGMLVHQAALSFEQMTGVAAPIDVMRRAAERSGSPQ